MNQLAGTLLEPPVFLVGPLRSGSTLIRLLLDHHSEINIFGEFEGAVSQASGNEWPEIEKYWGFVENDRQMQDLHLEVNRKLDYEHLVQDFFYQLSQRTDKRIVGASVHSRIDLLPRLWPDARFIHILRDPRDVARSAIGMGWVGNVHEGAEYWINVENHWDLLRKLVSKNQCLDVRYEELVKDPVRGLKEICSFLGVFYEEGMLEIKNTTTYSYPDPAYSYQWRKKLNAKEVGWVEYQCAQKLVHRGYELSGKPFSPPGFVQMIGIKIQSRLYRANFNIKRWGLRLWLLHVMSKKIGFKSLSLQLKYRINEIERKHLK